MKPDACCLPVRQVDIRHRKGRAIGITRCRNPLPVSIVNEQLTRTNTIVGGVCRGASDCQQIPRDTQPAKTVIGRRLKAGRLSPRYGNVPEIVCLQYWYSAHPVREGYYILE